MNKLKYLPITLGGAAVAVLLWNGYRVQADNRQLQERLEALQRSHVEDGQRLDGLARDTARLRNQALAEQGSAQHNLNVTVLAQRTAASTALPDEGEAAEGEQGAKSTRVNSAPVELVVANMEAMFETEAADASAKSWTQQVRQRAEQFLAGEGATIESIECRTTMCRLESVQEDMDYYRKFVFDVTHSDVCKDCFYTKSGETSTGKPIVTMYMAREGKNLPRVE